jgi:hypothetical protein
MHQLDKFIKDSYTKEDIEELERFLEKRYVEPLAALNYIFNSRDYEMVAKES